MDHIHVGRKCLSIYTNKLNCTAPLEMSPITGNLEEQLYKLVSNLILDHELSKISRYPDCHCDITK